MPADSPQVVQKLWNDRNVLRDVGTSYGDYVKQFSYLLLFRNRACGKW